LRQVYIETSPPPARPMDTLAASTSTAVTSVSRIRRAIGPVRSVSMPAAESTTTAAPSAAMPRPHAPSTTATGIPNHGGKNTTAITIPAAAPAKALTRSTTGHRQRSTLGGAVVASGLPWRVSGDRCFGTHRLCRMPLPALAGSVCTGFVGAWQYYRGGLVDAA
jgi:hypothetical protein